MMRGEEDADGRVEVKEERPMCTRRGNRKKSRERKRRIRGFRRKWRF